MAFPVEIKDGYVLKLYDREVDEFTYAGVYHNNKDILVVSSDEHWFPLKELDTEDYKYYDLELCEIYGRGVNRFACVDEAMFRKSLWKREESEEPTNDDWNLDDCETLEEAFEKTKKGLVENGMDEDYADYLLKSVTVGVLLGALK